MSLIVSFRKIEYSFLDAVNKAAQRFLTSFFETLGFTLKFSLQNASINPEVYNKLSNVTVS